MAAIGLSACALRGGARRRRARLGRLARWRLLAKDEQEDATPEAEAERRQLELERQMRTLASVEDYQAAAAIRDELDDGSLDDDAKVLSTIREFYEALTSKDLQRVKSFWLEAPHVRCLHPGEDWSAGHEQVLRSWARLFKQRRFLQGALCVEDVRMHVRGASATVVCSERLRTSPTGRTLQCYHATNIFQKVDGRWLLVLRHVSHGKGQGMPDAGMGSWRNLPDMILFEDSDEEDEEEGRGGKSMLEFIVGQRQLSEPHGDSDPDAEDDLVLEEDDGMADARDTVRALRQLGAEQKLPSQARLRLIQEMLWNPGESMPERAHDLLLKGVPAEESEAAWEDFAGLMAMEAKRLMPQRGVGRQVPKK